MYLRNLKKRADELVRDYPYLEELLDFFIAVRTKIEETRKALGEVPLQKDQEHYKGRADALMPMIDQTELQYSLKPVKRLFCGICDMLLKRKTSLNKEEIAALAKAVKGDEVDLDDVLDQSLNMVTEEESSPFGIERGILTFIAVNTCKPLLFSIRESLKGLVSTHYQEGQCPICGNYPTIGGLLGEEGRLHLLCSLCEHKWYFPRVKCYYRKNDDHEKLSYFSVETDPRALRVHVCEKCKSYIKLFEFRQEGEALFEIEDVASIHLDILAGKEGYNKPTQGILGLHSI